MQTPIPPFVASDPSKTFLTAPLLAAAELEELYKQADLIAKHDLPPGMQASVPADSLLRLARTMKAYQDLLRRFADLKTEEPVQEEVLDMQEEANSVLTVAPPPPVKAPILHLPR